MGINYQVWVPAQRYGMDLSFVLSWIHHKPYISIIVNMLSRVHLEVTSAIVNQC